jgi:predicted ATPase
MPHLNRLTVRGFKSIRTLEDFELRELNVLIGANGAGKSNFINVFQMMAEMVQKRLQLYVQKQDGPDRLLFGTRKKTPQLDVELSFADNEYRISLEPAGDRLVFAREESSLPGTLSYAQSSLRGGHEEALLPGVDDLTFASYVLPVISGWRVYHFHDTSVSAPVRQAQPLRDNLRLKPDAGNLAPFLRYLRENHQESYRRIVETVRIIAPFFGEFVHRKDSVSRVELEWLEREDPDTPWGARQLSDGTLRCMCLVTLLLQPAHLQPETILIDEPELGLHPHAIDVIAALLRQASDTRQLIVSTQSVDLVNELEPEDVVVVDRRDGASVFERLDAERLHEWLEEFSLGELWKSNVLGGIPTR